jgi:hypothetical protein
MKSTPALREIDLYRQYLKYVLRDLAANIFSITLQITGVSNPKLFDSEDFWS